MSSKDYQQLREKIIEAVPEIMELKFGCKLLRTLPSGRSDIFKFLKYGTRADNASFLRSDVMTPVWFHFMEYRGFKILGRDITLEDVLVTIEPYVGNAYKKRADWMKVLAEWKMNLPLDQQSDELKTYLFNLLCKTEI